MKRIITAATALALLVTAGAPAFAQGDRDHGGGDRGGGDRGYRSAAPAYGRADVVDNGRYVSGDRGRARHVGDRYDGYPVVFLNGYWGYYGPTGIFITIPL